MSDTADPFVCPHCGADAAKLRLLADYVEWAWRDRAANHTEVQTELRQWAAAIVDREVT